MRNFYKKLIVGAVIAGTALSAGLALAQDTSATMSKDEARGLASQASVCSTVGTVKGDGSYNGNSKTWWFSLNNTTKPGCAPACVVNAVTKAAEVNWRCTGAIVPKPPVKKTIDLACAAAAVATREAAILSAFTTKSTAVGAAFTKRAADLTTAWAITTAKDRNKAITVAWKTFNTATRAAKKSYQTTNNAAWETFRTDAKACNASTAAEPAGSTNDANL